MQDLRKESKNRRESSSFDRKDARKVSAYKVLLIAFVLGITACSGVIQEEGKLDVYFCPGNCEEIYINFIQPKTKCAFYDLDSEALISELKKKNSEVLVFEEYYEGFGQKVGSRGLMHDKFCINGDKVITGSANPTERGLNVNFNNILVIESKTLSSNYRNEFNEIKGNPEKKTKATKVNLSGIYIENYFCPEDNCEAKVLATLAKASHSIHFMTFSFTSNAIGELLLEKSKSIEVSGLMESFGLNKYSEYEKLKDKVNLETTGAMLHHKVFIVDKSIVITGSYNPTKAGTEKNDENILIIHSPEIAKKYLDEFYRIQTFIIES